MGRQSSISRRAHSAALCKYLLLTAATVYTLARLPLRWSCRRLCPVTAWSLRFRSNSNIVHYSTILFIYILNVNCFVIIGIVWTTGCDGQGIDVNNWSSQLGVEIVSNIVYYKICHAGLYTLLIKNITLRNRCNGTYKMVENYHIISHIKYDENKTRHSRVNPIQFTSKTY